MDPIQMNPADDLHPLPTTLEIPTTQDHPGSDLHESNSSPSEEFAIAQDSESDCESQTSPVSDSQTSPVSDSDPFSAFTDDEMMTRVEGLELETITKTFVSGMGMAGGETRVVAVHRNLSSGLMRRARFESFRAYTEAVASKCGGNPNIKNAWFAGTKDEIAEILYNGFSSGNEAVSGWIHLAPASLDAAAGCGADKDGMRHVLLCRVIMGKSELMPGGFSRNRHGSSEFDSGVDSMLAPRKYFVWSGRMNSHICPTYVVSFKAPDGFEKYVAPVQRVTSFLDLLPVLARSLPAAKMDVLYKLRDDYWEKKISLAELHRRFKWEVDEKVIANAMNVVPERVSFPSLMKVLPRFLPASKMAVLGKLLEDSLAKKISHDEMNRQVRLVVDKNVMAEAMKLMRPTQGSPGLKRGTLVMAALARLLPPSQMKILGGLVMDFRAKKISGDELNRKVKLIVDDKVMASAIKLVRPSTQQRSNSASAVRDIMKEPFYLPALLPFFEKDLSPQKMALLTKSINDLRERKISRAQVIQRVKLIVGNELLVSALKNYRSGQQNV